MKDLDTIEKLISELDNQPSSQYPDLVKRINLCSEDFERFQHWLSDCYTRNCLKKTEEYELILLCWEKGQTTPIHCHNSQECWVYVVDGDLSENFFESDSRGLPQLKKSEQRHKGQYTFMHDEMGFHDLHNTEKQRSMTLHLYAGPVKRCRIYDDTLQEFVWRDLAYHSYDGQLLTEVS